MREYGPRQSQPKLMQGQQILQTEIHQLSFRVSAFRVRGESPLTCATCAISWTSSKVSSDMHCTFPAVLTNLTR
jgi:hypothetical protein